MLKGDSEALRRWRYAKRHQASVTDHWRGVRRHQRGVRWQRSGTKGRRKGAKGRKEALKDNELPLLVMKRLFRVAERR